MCPLPSEAKREVSWQVGLRQGENGPLIGFISAVPVVVSIYGEQKETAEINFFVLHTDAR